VQISENIRKKQKEYFNTYYKNHWMIWRGKVILSDNGSVSLDVNNKGVQDLIVELERKNDSFSLNKGQIITVKFLMKSCGGCFLPFSGEKGIITTWN